MYKIGWFSTGRGSGSRALLETIMNGINKGDIKAKIAFVFCNRERGQTEETDMFLDQVASYSIPLVCLSSKKFKSQHNNDPNWRINYDREIMELLKGFQVDICVLAGYMLIVGPEMCQRYDMINLHPALPGGPKGTWREVIWELIDSKASKTGVMMHLAIPEVDEGPPMTYCEFPIRGELFDKHWKEIEGLSANEIMDKQGENNALFKLIREEGVKREQPLIAATLQAFSEGKIRIENGQVVNSEGNILAGYSLSQEIENLLQNKP